MGREWNSGVDLSELAPRHVSEFTIQDATLYLRASKRQAHGEWVEGHGIVDLAPTAAP